MKILAISNPEGSRALLNQSRDHGYITFVYHHADPNHELLDEKFLYVHTDQELTEKIRLIEQDLSVRDLLFTR